MRGAADSSARFQPGDAVRIKINPSSDHIRTPWYIQGKVGSVEHVQGRYRNPESLAYGGTGLPKQFLYLVGFDHGMLWEKPTPTRDRVLVDVYEHWLEPA